MERGEGIGKMSKMYTAEEIAKHNHEDDLWMVYKNGVYDLTKFLREHPGGEEVLINLAGQDGTQCFDDIGHSGEAIQLRETYRIGTMVGSFSEPSSGDTNKAGVQDPMTNDDYWEYKEPKYETSPLFYASIVAAIAIYAMIFYYFWFS